MTVPLGARCLAIALRQKTLSNGCKTLWQTIRGGGLSLLLALPVIAQPIRAIEINPDTSAFQNKTLQLGKLSIQVSYTPLKREEVGSDRKNLTYQILNDGKPQLTGELQTAVIGHISLLDLDNNLSPEVAIKTYTGGTHCCTTLTIFSAAKGQPYGQAQMLEGLDGTGGEFKDLDGNGSIEFISSDNRFLYNFSGYAQAFPPSQILAWSNGKFIDVTRRYPKELRARAWLMFQQLQELEKGGTGLSTNGILAGYVAQKAMLGEYDAGWQLMLARYDKTTTWGLEKRDSQGREVGKYANFPDALKAFLIQSGYLDQNGQPKK